MRIESQISGQGQVESRVLGRDQDSGLEFRIKLGFNFMSYEA